MRKIIVISAIILPLIACHREDPYPYPVGGGPGVDTVAVENTAEYDIEYQFSKDVIRFADERSLQYILSVEENETVVLDADLPQDLHPVVGSILSADVSDVTPYGLGNRVLSIVEEDGCIYCETEVAAIDDVFSVLELSARIPVLELDGDTLVDSEGTVYDLDRATISDEGELVPLSRVAIGSPELLCLNIPGKAVYDPDHPESDSNGFYLTGQIAFGAVLIIEISLSKRTFEISLEPSAGISALAGFQYEKTLKEFWPKNFRKTMFPKTRVVDGWVQIGPVTLRPFVDITFAVGVKAKGECQFKFNKTSAVKVGWNEKGAIKENKSTGNDGTGFVKEFLLDGKMALVPEFEFDMGLGLWTRNIAAEITPTMSLEMGADLELTNNENSWRLNPNLYVTLGGEARGRVLIDLFSFFSLSREMTLADWTLFHHEWPLLPSYVDSSADVTVKQGVSPVTFSASYALTGGLMSKFGAIYPALRIYRGGDLVLVKDDDYKVNVNDYYEPRFLLEGLEEDVSYTAKPSIRFMNRYFDLDGYPFSSVTPTAAITDIVQTGSEYGSFTHNGYSYDYEFYFYVSSYIKGSANCREWGIYDPQSDHIYYPYALEDGRITQYWTGWSDNPSATWTKTPYVILPDGSRKLYEPHTHTCTYGGGGPVMHTRSWTDFPNGSSPCRLDSVVINGYTFIPESLGF